MAKPTIFISHINEEKETALILRDFIEKKFLNTINVFASSHEKSIKLGDEWFEAIKESLNNCCLLLIICSPISV